MWFVYPVEFLATYWMNGMLFPLDIVWVNGALTVVDVTNDAPQPAPGTPPDDLPRYSPSVPVRYVLEINAGLAEDLGIVPGARVTVTAP
jgi:uncharacterized membrane protein (UPF0127 family)